MPRHCEERLRRSNPGSAAQSLDCFASLAMTKKKGKRNAERRCSVTSAPSRARRAPSGARSPLGVPPRHLRQRPNATAQLEPRDFLGLVRSARPDGSKDAAHRNAFLREAGGRLPCVTRGHYPRLAVPAQRDCTRSPVMMPVGRVLPKPPESRSDEPRPAGTALAPPDGVTRPASLYVSEILSRCNGNGDECQASCRDRSRRLTGRAAPLGTSSRLELELVDPDEVVEFPPC